MEVITSSQNPKIKNVLRLRERKHRLRQQRTLVDGVREIQRAILGGFLPLEVFVRDNLVSDRSLQSPEVASLLQQLQQANVSIWEVAERPFEKIAYGNRDEGMVAVVQIPDRRIGELAATLNLASSNEQSKIIGIIERIEKPGNIGAVIRSADGAGLDAVICVDCVTDLFNPNVIRASLGTIFGLPVLEASAAEVRSWLEEYKFATRVARVDGAVPYWQAAYLGRCAIVLGSEADGVTDDWKSDQYQGVYLPMHGLADSLNISATAAVLFYEAKRQRSHNA
ncbi:MAG: TrmH family RNA methyltransferase [Pirellulaceae bacterium]